MQNILKHKKILLGITGSIAALKSAELIRLLKEQGADVRVIMSAAAKEFITPLALQTYSGNPVYDDGIFAHENPMEHIELARWADLILIAPASADFIARLSHGFANDLLTAVCLATTAKIIVAPAMNQQMWLNSFTQQNIQQLLNHQIDCWGPAIGLQACGENGPGRMLEPQELLTRLQDNFINKNLSNFKIVITAGPTQEAIDPIRYITNHSSGKMGYALAQAASELTSQVILISGPTHLACPENITRISVTTAAQMREAVMQQITNCEIFIAAAAVADYSFKNSSAEKIKKQNKTLTLQLERTSDILAEVAILKKPPFTVGFAAETTHVIQHAQEKLAKKKINIIIANQVGPQQGFNCDENSVTIIQRNKEMIQLPLMSKKLLAQKIIRLIYQQWQNQGNLSSHVKTISKTSA